MDILSDIYNLYQRIISHVNKQYLLCGAFPSVPTIDNFNSISRVHKQNIFKEVFPCKSLIHFFSYFLYVQTVEEGRLRGTSQMYQQYIF